MHIEKLKTSSVSICTEEFKCQIYCRNGSSFRAFYIINTDTNIESLKSLHTLFNKYLGHMLVKFEQNRMVRNILNLQLFGKKWFIIFERGLEDVSVTKTIGRC